MQVQINNKVRSSWVPTGLLNHTVHLVEEQNAKSGADAQTHVHAGGTVMPHCHTKFVKLSQRQKVI